MLTHGNVISLAFSGGTLEIRGWPPPDGAGPPPGVSDGLWDARIAAWRSTASAYADVVRGLVRARLPFEDRARAYTVVEAEPVVRREPRPYQAEALESWRRARGRGVVVLPTGAGKTQVAVMAMEAKMRSTLIVVPTLELLRQWVELVASTFGVPVGIVGGGEYDLQPFTVTTYDSAHLHMDRFGARFGLVVFDECHHLPSPTYAQAARMCIAPYRLGLTATPERSDGREALLADVVGPIVYRRDIQELSGRFLSSYDTIRIRVDLSEDERAAYEEARGTYLDFIRSRGIRLDEPSGFQEFIVQTARTEEGRAAMRAYRRQRELAFAAPGKLAQLTRLIHDHRSDRVIVFTWDNKTAYAISRALLLPVITHHTKAKERIAILSEFRAGTLPAVVTSRVLNEGVDVPEANVAIVLSGSGSVREHVQRLGRVLRKQEGKRATFYELVTRRTSETFTSERRRDHDAYR